jgi:pullulanase/glycogen debranching enzyme
VLSDDERRTLGNWSRRRSTAQGLALRARIVLACADGGRNTAVAARLGVNRRTVTVWRARFLTRRLDGLHDEPRPGVPRTITDAQVEEVVIRTLEEVPEGATHWSKRELVDDDFLVLVNAWWEPLGFVLPQTRSGAQWHAEIDSYDPAAPTEAAKYRAGDQVTVGARAILVIRSPLSTMRAADPR